MKFSNSNMYKISIFFAIHNTSSCLKLTIIIHLYYQISFLQKVSMKTFNDSKWNSCKIEVLISSETALSLSLSTATAFSISLSLSHSCFLFVNTLYFVINEWLTFSQLFIFYHGILYLVKNYTITPQDTFTIDWLKNIGWLED